MCASFPSRSGAAAWRCSCRGCRRTPHASHSRGAAGCGGCRCVSNPPLPLTLTLAPTLTLTPIPTPTLTLTLTPNDANPNPNNANQVRLKPVWSLRELPAALAAGEARREAGGPQWRARGLLLFPGHNVLQPSRPEGPQWKLQWSNSNQAEYWFNSTNGQSRWVKEVEAEMAEPQPYPYPYP